MKNVPGKGNGLSSEFDFLRGPRSRFSEFIYLLKVVGQFIRGFRKLHFVGPCVTFFGSARFGEEHPYYKSTRALAAEVSKMGFTIMTGGGPGVMEAANRGARDAGGPSVGCNIVLPHEQKSNAYLDEVVTFRHFFVRKVLLLKYSYAFIVMPGGAGTLDELYETFTLIQTGKIKGFPIVLFGTDYWKGILEQMNLMREQGTISPEDMDIVFVTDDIREATDYIRRVLVRDFAPDAVRKNPKWYLWEK
jgi:uncharacterized protein (TIGR00730 family)